MPLAEEANARRAFLASIVEKEILFDHTPMTVSQVTVHGVENLQNKVFFYGSIVARMNWQTSGTIFGHMRKIIFCGGRKPAGELLFRFSPTPSMPDP
ncbi:MAG: hypothetical protein WD851_07570 [Pirellulales bacterium]